MRNYNQRQQCKVAQLNFQALTTIKLCKKKNLLATARDFQKVSMRCQMRPESSTTKDEFREYRCVRFADQTLLEFYTSHSLWIGSVNPLRTDIIKPHGFMIVYTPRSS